jgi:hypothetical protein
LQASTRSSRKRRRTSLPDRRRRARPRLTSLHPPRRSRLNRAPFGREIEPTSVWRHRPPRRCQGAIGLVFPIPPIDQGEGGHEDEAGAGRPLRCLSRTAGSAACVALDQAPLAPSWRFWLFRD